MMGTYLIAEDDVLHRGFLREVLGQSEVGCTELIEAENGEQAIRLTREREPDGVILDLQMPQKTGVQAAKAIWDFKPELPIIFWSNYAEEAYVRGIARIVPPRATYGYLLKTASKDRLKRALQCVFVEGQNIIDREVRGIRLRGARQSDGLTEGEFEVLLDVAIGLTDQAIADHRKISMRSVQGRLHELYSKLGLIELSLTDGRRSNYNTRTRAVAIALTSHLINSSGIEAAAVDYQRARDAKGAT
jgi:DNA-binding NarL/FixJ family response regulator